MRLTKLPDMFESADLDGEIVMIHAQTGKFFVLKGMGLEVWQRLDEESELDRLCSGLSDDYDASDDTIRAEVRTFCDELVAIGFARYD